MKRNPTVNPLSYRMPDLWKSTSSSALQESSVFRSRTKRLEEDPELSEPPMSRQSMRKSLERERGRNLGRNPFALQEQSFSSAPTTSHGSKDGLQMGELGMQSLEEDYLVSSTQLGEGSSRVFNAVDPNFRHPTGGSGVANQMPHHQHQRLGRSADSYDPDISPARHSRGSPKSRGFSPDPRPVSPTQEAVLHSKQRGFSFTGGGSGRESPTNNGFKVFTREQLPDGSYTVRPITLMDYMEREESLRHSIEDQLQPRPIPLPRTASPDLSAKKRLMAASRIPKPLSFAATSSQEILPMPRAQTSQVSLSKASSSDSGLRPLSRHTTSAPVNLGIKNSYRGPPPHSMNINDKGGSSGGGGGGGGGSGPMAAGSLIMDDSLYGDDDDSLDGDHRVHTKSIHFADDDPVEKKSGIAHPTSSYNKVILSRWTPPMCYSKKKAQDHFLQQRSHSPTVGGGPHLSLESPPGSAPQLEAYFAMKPRLKNPGKTFEQLDFHISSKKQQRRPKTTSTMY